VEPFAYNADGTIPLLTMTNAGAPQIGILNPYTRNEAETMAFSSGVQTQATSDGGLAVINIENGDYVKVAGVAFGDGAKSFSARIASATSGGKIEARLGGVGGTLVATCVVPSTNGWQSWQMVTCAVGGATGTKDLYLKFTGGSGYLFNVDYWQFA